MSLGFPHISEEAAAHLFGVPHRHEHRASELRYKARRGSDSPHLAKYAPGKRAPAPITARSRGVCFQGSRESVTATGGGSLRPLPWQVRAEHWQLSSSPFDGLTLNTSRHNYSTILTQPRVILQTQTVRGAQSHQSHDQYRRRPVQRKKRERVK